MATSVRWSNWLATPAPCSVELWETVRPGQTVRMTIEAEPGSYLSWITMLICTNDGFTAIDSMPLPDGSQTVSTNAYDSGTEQNTEDFADMVPPCQGLVGVMSDDSGTGASNPDLAEGGVIVRHAGVKGGNDLVATHMWEGAVARVTITAGSISPPSTGTGGLADESAGGALQTGVAVAALLTLLSLTSVGIFARRSRA